jgi:hypothetical protein
MILDEEQTLHQNCTALRDLKLWGPQVFHWRLINISKYSFKYYVIVWKKSTSLI